MLCVSLCRAIRVRWPLVRSLDASQVYAEMTGFPLMEIDKEIVRSFPRHNYGDMTSRTKRMVQAFAASKRSTRTQEGSLTNPGD